jgi:ankyrin repeat protein
MLWEAAYRGKKNVVEYLVRRGADVNACGCHRRRHYVEISPYCAAKIAGRDEVADYLLENGAEIDIHTAGYLGDYDAVLSLLERGANLVNRPRPQHDMEPGKPSRIYPRPLSWTTPFCYAIIGGHSAVVELLISRGAAIVSHSEELLGFAVRSGRVDLVKRLLENGADASKAPRGYQDRGEMFQLLKSYGVEPADVNDTGARGWPALVYASRGDKGEHPEKVQRLLDLGADVNIRNYKGKTALHCAAKAGFVRVMGLLLAHDAGVNAVDKNGETPLFDAVRSTIKNTTKKKQAVMLLLENGGDVSLENGQGVTPLQLAQRGRREEASEIVEMFQQFSME